jgi:hypothetical protein
MAQMKRYTDCMEVREDLSAYFDGETTGEERELIESHLRDCAECLRELDTFKRVDDVYTKVERVRAASGFDARVRQAVVTGATSGAPRGRRIPRWAGPLVAAAAAAVVVFGGIIALEWRQADRTSVAMAPQQESASRAAELEGLAQPAGGPAATNTEGAWDGFSGHRDANEPGGESAEPTGEPRAEWREFVRAPGAPAPDEADAVPAGEGGAVSGGDIRGRADEQSLKRRLAASTAATGTSVPEEMPDTGDAADDRAAVLGRPLQTPAPEAAGVAADSTGEADRSVDEAKPRAERQANLAGAVGEVVSRAKLRSFNVGQDGVWYEDGYQGEPVTPLARDSQALRELMKRYPETDWNRLLGRPARQIFQLDDAWYDLAAGPEPE